MSNGFGPQVGAHVLLVDRDPDVGRGVRNDLEQLDGRPSQFFCVSNGTDAANALKVQQFDVVIIDLASVGAGTPEFADGLSRLTKLAGNALIIAVSAGGSVSLAVQAMRCGAHDYLAKPISGKNLSARILELAHRHGKEHQADSSIVPGFGRFDFEGFVGQSNQMQFVFEQIERIAPSSAPVFITGESGTGKQLCAQALHKRSARSAAPFIAVNCGTTARDLMESEVFGADQDHRGAAELAHGGTLFLDEVGELDLRLQSKLLRFLQTGAIVRIGDAVERPVDVRVVCATSRNPMHMIAERRFREDLFYRLHVLPIHLPPLRQRVADILPLATHFLLRYALKNHRQFRRLGPGVADSLIKHEWPGNVRQLQNLVRRVVDMFDGYEVSHEMLAAADIETLGLKSAGTVAVAPSRETQILPMWRQEQDIIEAALSRYNGNIAQAAAALEISPSTIYRKKQAWEHREIGIAGAA